MSALRLLWKGVLQGMKRFGSNIAGIVNSVLLAIVYIIGVGITSLIAKLTGKRFLNTKLSPKSKTYWEDLNLGKRPQEEHYRQF